MFRTGKRPDLQVTRRAVRLGGHFGDMRVYRDDLSVCVLFFFPLSFPVLIYLYCSDLRLHLSASTFFIRF
jgi:hypothetical protein